jgi:predicted DCC family thiol-disulfide oxidoreductase YuxK
MNNAIARRYLLEKIYNQLSDEDKRTFVLMTMQDKSTNDILQAIQQNRQHLERLVEHADRDRWYTAFGSDVAANVLTTSAFWIIGKLFAKR